MLYVQKDIMITMNVCVSWLHVRSWLYVDWSCVWNSTLVHSVTTCSLLYSDLLIRTPDTFLSLFSLILSASELWDCYQKIMPRTKLILKTSEILSTQALFKENKCHPCENIQKVNWVKDLPNKKGGDNKPKSHIGQLEACGAWGRGESYVWRDSMVEVSLNITLDYNVSTA